jgi:protein involved in polysaccharide export with SLBB domain
MNLCQYMSIRTFFPAFIFMLFALPASAQTMSELDRSRYSPAAYYNYSEPGDVTILVNVWGTVRNPGLYEVPRGTTMSTLFSVAGGPSITPRMRHQRRTIDVKLSRNTGSQRETILHTVMDNDIIVTDQDPVLQVGDVLTVETVTRQGFSWRDAFPIIGAVASIALIVERAF